MSTNGQISPALAIETPVSRALSAAVLASQRDKHDIAREVGIAERTLRRYLTGKRAPVHTLRDRILLACGVKPATSLLSAELGFETMIGSKWQSYFDTLVPALYDQTNGTDEVHVEPIDPRWAVKHAKMFLTIWAAINREHQTYLDRTAI